jgi:hypothetical protein
MTARLGLACGIGLVLGFTCVALALSPAPCHDGGFSPPVAEAVKSAVAPPANHVIHFCHLTFDAYDYNALVSNLGRLKRSPLYQRLSIADWIARYCIIPAEPYPIRNFAWQPERHDLNCRAGKAAWLVEELLWAKLSKITPHSTDSDIASVKKEATLFIQGYRAGAVAARRPFDQPVEEMKRRYRGKIKPGHWKDAMASYPLMHAFLEEWFPIGKRLTALSDKT